MPCTAWATSPRPSAADEALDHLLATLACHSVKRAGDAMARERGRGAAGVAGRRRSALALPARPAGAGAPAADRARTSLRPCLTPDPAARAVVAILGPTASGKSALGLALAAAAATARSSAAIRCRSTGAWTSAPASPPPAERAARARTTCWIWSTRRAVPRRALGRAGPRGHRRGDRAAAGCRSSSAAPGLYFRALVRGLFEAPPSDPAIRARHQAGGAASWGCRPCTRAWPAIDPEAAGAHPARRPAAHQPGAGDLRADRRAA